MPDPRACTPILRALLRTDGLPEQVANDIPDMSDDITTSYQVLWATSTTNFAILQVSSHFLFGTLHYAEVASARGLSLYT
jgi:hypothetical protein